MFEPSTDYGPVLMPLVNTDRQMPLDAGSPDRAKRDELQRLTIATAFEHAQVTDESMAQCCLAGVWLLYDFLDESHTISQGISTSGGSYWHAIMHRREGDFSNAKYWFRKVGEHEVFARLAEEVSELEGNPAPGGATWDPFAFVDRTEQALRTGDESELKMCLLMQHLEWQTLFDHCYRQAT